MEIRAWRAIQTVMEPESATSARTRVIAAEPAHLEQIARIYAEVVVSSPATFDLEPPPAAHWERMLAAAEPRAGHFLLVAVDDAGAVLGYAKSGRFRDRAAYDTTCETSIYVDRPARGRGVGRALYERLIELLDASPLRLAVGGMTEPNPASGALHEALGFTRVGTFEGVGFKFGQAWSVTWYQRPLV
jgi:L-amino acid N-acyltransferase YncA